MRLQKVRRVLFYTFFLNMAVAAAKVIYGYMTNSISMLSDGFHSFFDGTSNIIGIIGIWIASHPPDEKHPYGHKKYETIATIAVAFLIFIACFQVLRKAYFSFKMPAAIEVTSISFAVMAITLLVNLAVMTYETKKGRELTSDFLIADALHTRSDIFVSVAVIISLITAKFGYPLIDFIISLITAKFGYPLIDSIAAIIIAFLIAKMGFNILKSASDVLADTVCIRTKEIEDVVMTIEGVKGCHRVRTRGREDEVRLDLHVLIDPKMQTDKAHDLAHAVEETIKNRFPHVVDVLVHIEPYTRSGSVCD
ncbi:MAG: cation transporter [Nitrospirae bacterium]|nr:cation transporter [Nitrospirota bacterium]